MKIFLDTEFTASPPSIFGFFFRPKLISIALVAEDGETFYAETSSYKAIHCSGFVKKHVLPVLTGPVLSPADLKAQIIAFLVDQPYESQIACDHEFDFELLIKAVKNDLPPNIRPTYFDLSPIKTEPVFIEAVERYFATGKPPHHALNDADAMRIGRREVLDKRALRRANVAHAHPILVYCCGSKTEPEIVILENEFVAGKLDADAVVTRLLEDTEELIEPVRYLRKRAWTWKETDQTPISGEFDACENSLTNGEIGPQEFVHRCLILALEGTI